MSINIDDTTEESKGPDNNHNNTNRPPQLSPTANISPSATNNQLRSDVNINTNNATNTTHTNQATHPNTNNTNKNQTNKLKYSYY